MKILCTADLHIGRRPSRLPATVDSTTLSCARAWSALVETAIAERVDLLLLAGDLIDQANRFYEATGAVEAGVRALAASGIATIAVAGNHDCDTLPWIARGFAPEEFRVLGSGGRWERHTVQRDGRAVLHVDGWSFPSRVMTGDPLEHHPRSPRDGVPVLGLLHADLEQPGSRHAPVSLSALRGVPADFWLLGHVHRHARHEQAGAATVLYPGSPQAMDPGEPGVHGPWLVEIDDGGRFETRQLPLSAVRYETIEVDAGGVEEEGEVDWRIADAVHASLRDAEGEAGPLRYLSLRVVLTGRTPLHRWLQTRSWEEATALEAKHGAMTGLVERVEVATLPARDLEALSRGRDAPALLARLVRGLELGSPTPEEALLLRAAVARSEEVRGLRPYLVMDDATDAVTRERVAEILTEQALLLLDELVAGKEVA